MSSSMNPQLQTLIGDAGEVAGYLWQKGWAERNAGNISIDITHLAPPELTGCDAPLYDTFAAGYPALANRCYLITGTGKRMRDLPGRPGQNATLIRLSADGRGYHFLRRDEFCCKPTSELNSHMGIHQMLRQAGARQMAVLHTHPNELIALTHMRAYHDEAALNGLLWAMHPETKIVVPEGVGFVPYRVPGSDQLEAATLHALQGRRVVIWEKHGAVAVGMDVFEAFDLIDTLNKSAQVFFLCMSAGEAPDGLTDAQIDELEDIFRRK
jgi:rhamnulose-1-phosphate aldolase